MEILMNQNETGSAHVPTAASPNHFAAGDQAPHVTSAQSMGTAQPFTGWERFKLVVKVVEVRLRFIAILIATALIVGYWDTIENYWQRETRADGRLYGLVRSVAGERG